MVTTIVGRHQMTEASPLETLRWLRDNVHKGSWKRMVHDLRVRLTNLANNGGVAGIRDQILADIKVIVPFALQEK